MSMYDYLSLATQAAKLEQKNHWLEASEYWLEAATCTREGGHNHLWANARATLCRRKCGHYEPETTLLNYLA
ncbi:TPA: ANR family transcriptional regulator [Vibrio parahaemolyticus]|nr:ANR family transcriptional regulator [Vibrio parahaemolyticus]HAS6641303.1 ANR family transcriptional regulator [Vibrio parahaemolyticus]